MITEIKKVLEKQRVVSLFDLAVILKKDAKTLLLPLKQLERKKYLEKIDTSFSCSAQCSGCMGCDKDKTIFYKLCEKKNSPKV